MTSAIPHSSVLAEQLREFLEEIGQVIDGNSKSLLASASFRGCHKICLATHTVLGSIKASKCHQLLRAAHGIPRRIPILLTAGQISLAYVQLRRFVELVVWLPYFTEHQVEWDEFLKNPSRGFSRDHERPIEFAAHRELGWYVAYCRERFESEETGMMLSAIKDLSLSYSDLSGHTHARFGAVNSGFTDAFDNLNAQELQKFQALSRDVLSAGVILVLGARPGALARLTTIQREWFDWLIGQKRGQQIRSCKFGI